jgi:hypothetical protein
MELTLSKPQSVIWTAYEHYRFLCICAGRRGGKTYTCVALILRACSEPNQNVWYVSVTYRLTKRLMWRELKKAISPQLIVKKNETELSIELVNGSMIQLFGADNPDGLVGASIDVCFIDEAGLMPNLSDVVEQSIRPALADREGKLILVTTPRGFNYFYRLCSACWNFPYPRAERVESNNNWFFYSFTTLEGGRVTQTELAEMSATMPLKLFNQEMKAEFTTPANRVYENFDYTLNQLAGIELATAHQGKELLIGIDFNVNPMSAVIAVAASVRHPENGYREECWVIGSIEVMCSNTQELCDEIKNRYPGYPRYLAFPDPAGKARKTSAAVGITDFVILQQNGFIVSAPSQAPLVVDRINAVNAMLCSADNDRRLFVSQRAKALTQSLNGQCYKEGTSIPEKGGNPDLSHMADALGYLIYSRFNLFGQKKRGVERVY